MQQNEILQMQGALAVLEKELEELEISGNNSVIILYNLLNPDNLDKGLISLQVNNARVEMKKLSETWEKAKEKRVRADKLKNRLSQIKSMLL